MGAPQLNRGPKFLQDAFNALAKYADSIVPIGGADIQVADSPIGAGRRVSYVGPHGSTPPPVAVLPFAIVAPMAPDPAQILVQVYPYSYLRAVTSDTDPLTIDGISTGDGDNEDFAIAAGDQIWLQVDTDDGLTASAASIEHGGSPPYDDGDLVTFSGSGTTDDNYVWDETFLPLAQVFASDGTAQRGGVLFSGAGVTVEVVRLVYAHLAMRPVLYKGCWAMQPFPDGGPTF